MIRAPISSQPYFQKVQYFQSPLKLQVPLPGFKKTRRRSQILRVAWCDYCPINLSTQVPSRNAGSRKSISGSFDLQGGCSFRLYCPPPSRGSHPQLLPPSPPSPSQNLLNEPTSDRSTHTYPPPLPHPNPSHSRPQKILTHTKTTRPRTIIISFWYEYTEWITFGLGEI